MHDFACWSAVLPSCLWLHYRPAKSSTPNSRASTVVSISPTTDYNSGTPGSHLLNFVHGKHQHTDKQTRLSTSHTSAQQPRPAATKCLLPLSNYRVVLELSQHNTTLNDNNYHNENKTLRRFAVRLSSFVCRRRRFLSAVVGGGDYGGGGGDGSGINMVVGELPYFARCHDFAVVIGCRRFVRSQRGSQICS